MPLPPLLVGGKQGPGVGPWNWAACMLHVERRMASAFWQQGRGLLLLTSLKGAAAANCSWLPAFVATGVEFVVLPGRVHAVVARTFALRAGVVAGVPLSVW